MKTLKDYLRKTLAQKNLGKAMIGALALNTVRTVLGMPELEWYVSFNVFFLKMDNQMLKIEVFKQKNKILEEVNIALGKVWYEVVIDEIRLK